MAGKAFKQLEEIVRTDIRYQSGLSEQELELLKLIADGASVLDISQMLYMSERSVKRKTQEVLEKMGASNRAQAVAEAFKRGIL